MITRQPSVVTYYTSTLLHELEKLVQRNVRLAGTRRGLQVHKHGVGGDALLQLGDLVRSEPAAEVCDTRWGWNRMQEM